MSNDARRGVSLAAILVSVLPAIMGQGQPPAAPVAPLADLVVPPGFKISVFASGLIGARLMAVSPEGVLLVARRRTHEVVALPDRNKDGIAEPDVILTGQTNAHSLAFHGGYLYIATTPAVMRVRWTNGAPDGTPSVFVIDCNREAMFTASPMTVNSRRDPLPITPVTTGPE